MVKTFSQFLNEGLGRKVVIATTHENPTSIYAIVNPTPEVMAILDNYESYGWLSDECDANTNLVLCDNNDETVHIYPVEANASNFKQVLIKQCQQCLDDIRKVFEEDGLGNFEGEYECEDMPLIGYMYMEDVSKYRKGEDLLNDILTYIDQTEVDGDSSSAYYIINIDNGDTLYGKGVSVNLYTSDDFLAMYNE